MTGGSSIITLKLLNNRLHILRLYIRANKRRNISGRHRRHSKKQSIAQQHQFPASPAIPRSNRISKNQRSILRIFLGSLVYHLSNFFN